MPNYHVTVHGTDREAMADLRRAHHVYVYRQTLIGEALGYRVSALADELSITRLQGAGYRVEQHEDVHQVAEYVRHHAASGEHGYSFAPTTGRWVLSLGNTAERCLESAHHLERRSCHDEPGSWSE